MPPTGSSTIAETSSTSNRRQPVRQTRTQPPKYAFPGACSLSGRGSLGGPDERPQNESEPGFYPGLTHFADSITALPKEMTRHFTMLKEVDAKIYNPEDNLKKMLSTILPAPIPPSWAEATRALAAQSQANSLVPSAAASVNGVPLAAPAMAPGPSQASFVSQATSIDMHDLPRRQQFLNLRVVMGDMLQILEEKNHVLATATESLGKHIARCESSWPEIEKEISEETRWGNLHHWAYTDKSSEKRDARAERPRREAAIHHNFAAVLDDFGAVRGTGKRRAQQAQIETEIEEARANKRVLGAGKAKKPVAQQATAVGLGLTTNVANPSKRRKVEEVAPAAAPLERSLSAIFGKVAGPKGAASPRSRSPAVAKRIRGAGSNLAVNGKGRVRAGTGASAANSPLMASSPVLGTFNNVHKPNVGPAVGAPMRRQSSSRARQNSTQTSAPAPTSNPKQVNGTPRPAEITAGATPAKLVGRTSKLEATEDTEPKTAPLKQEESTTSRARPPSISTGTRASGKASKTATPIQASFAEAVPLSRPRSHRANHSHDATTIATTATATTSTKISGGAGSPALSAPNKRSHKKGAGLAAQQAREEASAKVTATTTALITTGNDGADDEETEGAVSQSYCYCGTDHEDIMIACDNEKACERAWFHLSCVGLSKAPPGKLKWYCKECKEKLGIV